ncbi:MAG TPA: hypothetical protein VFP48_07385 [Steroidobacteraceae bacterium]|nr:hypothetical protein [Steroidobacteraceae bacterium]
MEAVVPRLEARLPDLHEFVRTLARQIEGRAVRDGDTLVARFRDFYTDARLAAIDAVLPGWQAMGAYANGATLHHVTQAMIALQLLPEYRESSSFQQAVLEWSVLCHDVGKQVVAGQRDALHAFRSATITARALPGAGFDTTAVYAAELDAWTRRVLDATVDAPDGKGKIQDNRALPDIFEGLDRLFGADTPATLVVQTVLLHQSLTVVPEWPNPGSLASGEQSCIGPALLPVLEGMMLVDSDAWQLFDPASKAKFRDCTLAVFDALRRQASG